MTAEKLYISNIDIQNKRLNFLLFTFLGYLVFIPSITFSLVHAEIFPWALIFTLVYMRKIDKNFVLLILLFLFSSLYGVYLSNGNSSNEAVRSFAAYMNSLLIFTFLLRADYKLISKFFPILKKLFYFLTILGLLQYFGLIGFIDPLFKFLIPRGSAESLAFMGNRGVTLLSSEPSRAAYEFLFVYVAFRTIFLNKKNFLIYDLFILIFMLFIIKSGVGMILTLAYLAIFYRTKFFILAMALTIIAIPILDHLSGRAISLLISIMSSNSILELYNMILNVSGTRLISIIASFWYGILEPLGGGIGNWKESSLLALQMTSLDPANFYYFRENFNGNWSMVRPSSYLFALMLDVGIIGCFVVLLLFFKIISKYFNLRSSNVLLFFLLYLTVIGEVGNPVPFVATAISFRYIYYQNKGVN